ncbi:MAG: TPM domain-containing protein [bacterium]|nr:TPM domain-containing protein [bacterium]
MRWSALVFSLIFPAIVLGYISPGQPMGFVNDFAKVLKPETISSLNQRLTQFAEDTSNEITVVTIPKLEDETIETYAEKLFQEWKIGKEKEDNGLLLLVSLEDKEVRIEVGYGLESVVTDIDSGRIIREIIVPAFRAGNYDGGINDAINIIIGLIGGEELPSGVESGGENWSNFFPYAIFILIYFASILGRSKSWWAGGIIGGVLGFIFLSGVLFIGLSILVGLVFDFLVSRAYKNAVTRGGVPPWWIGGGRGGGHSGGFGGFGGGMSGGGGASGRW